jgi:hypothetical protein
VKKRIIGQDGRTAASIEGDWLDLDTLVEVALSSENPEYPIESALIAGRKEGWRAGEPGTQTIRLVFIHSQAIRRIQLCFEEKSVERMQEYVLKWSSGPDEPMHEIVRQQWNFSPSGATAEVEDHEVDLPAVKILELVLCPDTSDASVFASLQSMRIA